MTDPRPARRPRTLTVAALLIAAEAAVAFLFGVLQLGQLRVHGGLIGLGVSVVMIGLALLLAAVARAVLRGRRWSRGPAVAVQLILLPTAWTFRDPPTTWVGVTLAAVAVVTLVALFHPRSTEVLVGPGD